MTLFSEKLAPAWWLILALGLFLPATWLIFLPLNWVVGVLAGLVLWGGSVAVLWFFAPRVTLTPATLRAGTATIDTQFIHSVVAFHGDDSRREKGPGLDARAWLVLVPWVAPVVKVTLADESDPTPYWLISCRDADGLVRAWNALPTST